MSNALKALIAALALCCMTTSAHALSAEFQKNYFIGMLNPKSWDGPWWWGLRSSVADVVVKKVSGHEIRSDRAGARAFALSFTLLNIGDSVIGKKLVLRAADQAEPDRLLTTLREAQLEQPWSVGAAAVAAALEPGESASLSIVVYQDASRALDEDAHSALIELDVSAE